MRKDLEIPISLGAPTIPGLHSRIWDVTDAQIKAANGREHAGIRSWLIFAPWMHPAWAWHSAQLIHLRGTVNGQSAILEFPDATHEFIVFALDPRQSVDSTSMLNFLEPVSICQQFNARSDAEALNRVERQFLAIGAGRLSVDSDYRTAWRILLSDAT